MGSVYEAGQLNILRMLELLHQALVLLWEERTRVAGHTPIAQLHPLHLQERNLQMARAMEDLRVMRWATNCYRRGLLVGELLPSLCITV